MQLLQLMSDGRFHSGESLGAAMGVSRAAIWKQLKRWQLKGLEFDVVPGKGYRWRHPVEWWDEEVLRLHMRPEISALIHKLLVMQSTGSTNAIVLEQLQSERKSGLVCLAEEQTAGRGRRGRQWLAPLGAGFYGSVGWVFVEGVAALEGLSLAVGLVVAEVLEEYGVPGVGLKWPNDIMLGQAKLGGILIEMQLDSEGRCLVVIGVGVNFSLPDGTEQVLGRDVADVADHVLKGPVERNRLGAMIIESVVSLLQDYGVGSFSALREAWCRRDILRGRHVELQGGGDVEYTGIARGVDQHGALIVETASGVRFVSSGEVSLRGV